MTREDVLIALCKIDELLVRTEALKAGIDAQIRRVDAEIGQVRVHMQALVDVQREKRWGMGHEQSRRNSRRVGKIT
jgi:hypothetical protein